MLGFFLGLLCYNFFFCLKVENIYIYIYILFEGVPNFFLKGKQIKKILIIIYIYIFFFFFKSGCS